MDDLGIKLLVVSRSSPGFKLEIQLASNHSNIAVIPGYCIGQQKTHMTKGYVWKDAILGDKDLFDKR